MKSLLLLLSWFYFSNVIGQETLTPEKLWQFTRVSGGVVSPDGKHILYNRRSFDMAANKGNTDLYVYSIETGRDVQLTQTPFSEMEAQWGPNNTIWYMSSEQDGLQIRTMDVNGNNQMSRSNFIDTEIEGFKISPSGAHIVVIEAIKYRESANDKYPDLPKANARIENDLMYRHWDHYDDNKRRHLTLFKLSDGQIIGDGTDILTGEPFDGIIPPMGGTESFCFSRDEKTIYYASKKLLGKDFALSTNTIIYSYDLSTGTTSIVDNTFQGYDNNPAVSVDGQLAWLAMKRDGFESDKNDIIIRDKSGKVRNLTGSIDLTVSDFLWHPGGQKIFFLSPINGTVQLFEINLQNGKHRQITKGQHDLLSISISGEDLICGIQTMVQPTELCYINVKNGDIKQLTHVNDALLKQLNMPKVEPHWVTTTDGKKMLVWMVLPPNFDPNKKYPALLYCQGGPQSQVSQFFSYRWNLSLMASKGYVVIAPNRRGLPGFGQEWNDAISKDWGGQAMKDYLSATDYAAGLSFVDKNRMGAVGASYGGYSVYMLAGIHEKRFQTFVSHCGLFNLESWYGTTEELFFADWDHGGPYWLDKNKENYQKNSPHKYVQNWDTPILVIHGGLDYRVPESEGMQAFQAARLKGLRSKFLYFPTEGHWVQSPQNSLLWQREFFEWLAIDLHP